MNRKTEIVFSMEKLERTTSPEGFFEERRKARVYIEEKSFLGRIVTYLLNKELKKLDDRSKSNNFKGFKHVL